MEKWQEVYENIIPSANYQVIVQNGEENGLDIKLESKQHIVSIRFGVVSGLRMLDEGLVLGEIFNEEQVKKYKQNNFKNTIYLVENSQFSKSIKSLSGDIYDYLDFKNYVIVTMNYIIEVISEGQPEIKVMDKSF